MTAQRSMTDEQLAARWDKHPWIDSRNTRWANPKPDCLFAPRPECIPSRDRWPYETNLGTHGDLATAQRLGIEVRFNPRPEFARPPVNPILSAFRDEQRMYSVMGDEDGQLHDYIFLLDGGWDVADIGGLPSATPVQVEFARKVLTRLANITKGSNDE